MKPVIFLALTVLVLTGCGGSGVDMGNSVEDHKYRKDTGW